MPTTTYRVLLAEDHALSRALFGRWLTSAGCDVCLVADAEAAMLRIRSTTFDLALLDVSLPGKDGLWLADMIGRMSPRTRIAFITGTEELPVSHTSRPEVVGALLKPIDQERLLELVRTALAHGPLGSPDGSWAASAV